MRMRLSRAPHIDMTPATADYSALQHWKESEVKSTFPLEENDWSMSDELEHYTGPRKMSFSDIGEEYKGGNSANKGGYRLMNGYFNLQASAW